MNKENQKRTQISQKMNKWQDFKVRKDKAVLEYIDAKKKAAMRFQALDFCIK